LAIQKLKKLWKNEYFQTAITIALILIIVFGFYFGAQAALGSEYPALAVASGSMLPTLNIGDLIIVQKIDPAQIHADPLTGDILVYKRGDELIVHRAISIRQDPHGVYWITTRGDNTNTNDTAWPSTQLVGKVIARIPAIGNLPLFLHSEKNMYILFLALIVILIILMLPFGFREEEESAKKEQPAEEKKLFSKISRSLFLYIIINIILLGLIIFSLWGFITIWQPGANPPHNVPIMGMLSDIQFHENFRNVGEVYLFQGFLSYQINYEVSGGIRQGVPTFSWFQFFLIILIIYNTWKLYIFLKAWKGRRDREKDVNV
jgi:signal peptidase